MRPILPIVSGLLMLVAMAVVHADEKPAAECKHTWAEVVQKAEDAGLGLTLTELGPQARDHAVEVGKAKGAPFGDAEITNVYFGVLSDGEATVAFVSNGCAVAKATFPSAAEAYAYFFVSADTPDDEDQGDDDIVNGDHKNETSDDKERNL